MKRSGLAIYMKSIIIVLVLIFLSSIAYQGRMIKTDSSNHVNKFQKAFHQKERFVNKKLNEFALVYSDTDGNIIHDTEYIQHLENLYKQYEVVFLVYDDAQLVFWSNNIIPFEKDTPPGTSPGVVQKKNGWYYFQALEDNNIRFVIYFVIKKNYKYQNEFLVNSFNKHLHALEDLFYISNRYDEGYHITGLSGKYLFSLVLRRETALYQTNYAIYLTALFLAVAAWLIYVFVTFRYFSRLFSAGRHKIAVTGFVVMLLIVRIVSFLLKKPLVFYEGYVFSPELYATSAMLPSLGDLLLNVSLVTIIGYFFFHNIRKEHIWTPQKTTSAVAIGLFMFLMIYFICGLALYLIESMVINSKLQLDVNFIFELDIYSLIGFLIIGLIFFAFYFYSIVICRWVYSMFKTNTKFWVTCFLSFSIIIAITQIAFGFKPLLYVLTLSAVFVFELDRKQKSLAKGFSILVISLFLFSVISTFALYRFNHIKDIDKRKTLSIQLASEQDPVAEFLFKEIENALFNDSQLQNLVREDPYNETAIYNYLQHHYFYDYWAKYEIQVTVCKPEELLLIKPANIEMPCAQFFEEYMASFGKESISKNLLYLDNNTGRNSYITRIIAGERNGKENFPVYHLYIEFDAKFLARDMGFPELLIDDAIDINRELLNYSYAIYKNGMLINEFGTFVYNMHTEVYDFCESEFCLFTIEGYSHLMYQKDTDTIIIISRPKHTALEAIAPFSYLFITFFLLAALFWLLFSKIHPNKLLKITFRARVQYSMIIILLLSALTMGGVSAMFIFNIYENKNLTFLNEKTHSVLREIEQTLAYETRLDHNLQPFLHDLLLQYSNIFFTDINLYSTDGILIASSRPKVFEEGLIGQKMNTLAYHKMHQASKSQFIHNEQIGNLEYLSAYSPLYNRYNEKLAYLNLPYFAKQSELRNEMSYFIVAFLNIYLLLVVLAVLLALFVSNYVTRPLLLIKDKLARIQLGKTNEKITWSRDDEIGSLINEYNRKIDELALSADLLARSERETAWREMARQVAHEIKNPLTPMKLSVQYLEKAWNEKVPDWQERLERFSKTMIDQIENLSAIASEFSDFAQMPAGNSDLIDIRRFLPDVIELFNGYDYVVIQLSIEDDSQPLYVKADRKQLLRVFNNLIKNAIQAYEKDETALIEVHCSGNEGQCIITVTDYGCGISENAKENIFNPYYTTKAKGMGLGLAMVKNIVESMNGSIGFTSTEGQGSSFVIRLPRVHKEIS